ncbi:MAG: hypothetical protein WAQ25_03850 [Candidatus Saccharimonas sp.]
MLVIAAVGLCVLPVVVYALTPISQGYIADETSSIGSIVSLAKTTTDHVVLADSNNSDSIVGVVVNDGSSPITLNTGGDNQVQVATNGVVPVLASTMNGDIAQGDPITASPIKGVGMKATYNAKVVGIAQGPVTGGQKQKVTLDGAEQEVSVGQLPVLVSVSYHYKQPEKTIIPAAIQNVANSLAGKKVDALPIIISAAIFVIMLITVTSIIYAMIRSSIISVGRNPMAQSAVYRNLIQLSVVVLAVIGVSVVAIYIVLTRL